MVRRRYVLKPRAKLMIAVLMIGYFIFTFVHQEIKMREQHVQMEHLRQKIQQVEEYNAELERQIEYTKSEEYVEKAARERFGWVKEGEIKFIEKQN